MADKPSTPKEAFLQRIDRRARFLKTLQTCGLGVYLPPDERARRQAIEQIVRTTARQSELPHLDAATLHTAGETVRAHLEAMQPLLPHDVQYRNRIKREW
ncbi:hypothetical protein [Azoarcus olearius]|uniref:Uncharacterized protein n=1 Tax=Azoarcus sp. (strain BH72) TaxID=418699 RepID=A1KAZ8_AZOSB|nr:hypothetical protein [Azoarcus olearius]CAL96004.1 hypothetical protein predicted by Glimmer/Critica [Azoarcus olearius]